MRMGFLKLEEMGSPAKRRFALRTRNASRRKRDDRLRGVAPRQYPMARQLVH